jgi:hypothetical protein
MKTKSIAIAVSTAFLAGCAYLSFEKPKPSAPTQQKVIRVWKGEIGGSLDGSARSACGIEHDYTQKYLDDGWRIVSSTPFSFEKHQSSGSYNCEGSEIVLEK